MAAGIEIEIHYTSSLNALVFKCDGDITMGDYSAHDAWPMPFLNVVSICAVPVSAGVRIDLTSGLSAHFKVLKVGTVPDDDQAVTEIFGENVPAELTTEYEFSEWAAKKLQKKWGVDIDNIE